MSTVTHRGYNMRVGEVKPVSVELGLRVGSLSITGASYRVHDGEGTALTSADPATVEGGVVTAPVTAGATPGERYVEFTVIVGANTLKERVAFSVE